MEYRCEAASVAGFVQQLAVAYVARGYFRYVIGKIPERKDPRTVDANIVFKYGLEIGKTSRWRRKNLGLANVQYLRFQRFFVISATDGPHTLFDQEVDVRDVRKGRPIKFHGYSISHRGGHVHVRIEWNVFDNLKAKWIDLAVHRKSEWFEARFRSLPFEPYAPVRGQLFRLLRKVNERRATANFDPVPRSCIRLVRRQVEPFAKPLVPSGEHFPSGIKILYPQLADPGTPAGDHVAQTA